MDIKICKNIAKYRKENKITQAQVAQYLGVSPQAVSKWEQEGAMPDVYLIPKIAFFFNISIDTLFGTSNVDTASLLVTKYATVRTDPNYRDAKEAVVTLLAMDGEDLKALGLLCHLEYQRSLEYLDRSQEACEKLLALSRGKDGQWEKRATMQLMRSKAMTGDYDFIEGFIQRFQAEKTMENFNYLLVALGECNQIEESLRWGQDYIDSFSKEDQGWIYPNLMEAALRVKDLEFADKCFHEVVKHNKDDHQIFNAWWLRLKVMQIREDLQGIKVCKTSLLDILPKLGLNAYSQENILKILEDKGGVKPSNF